jgi:hypothetical protein
MVEGIRIKNMIVTKKMGSAALWITLADHSKTMDS